MIESAQLVVVYYSATGIVDGGKVEIDCVPWMVKEIGKFQGRMTATIVALVHGTTWEGEDWMKSDFPLYLVKKVPICDKARSHGLEGTKIEAYRAAINRGERSIVGWEDEILHLRGDKSELDDRLQWIDDENKIIRQMLKLISTKEERLTKISA